MAAKMSQNGRKMAKMLHNAAKKFDWDDIICPYSKAEAAD